MPGGEVQSHVQAGEMTALRLLLSGNFFSNRNLHVFSRVPKDVCVLTIDSDFRLPMKSEI